MRLRRQAASVEQSRLRARDLFGEAVAGLLQRPARSVLTMLGTILGIGAFVVILGLTATAGGQIDRRFTNLTATEVTVEDVGTGDPTDNPPSFPADASGRVGRLNGTVSAGVWWTVPTRNPHISQRPGGRRSDDDAGSALTLIAAEPSTLAVMRATMRSGRLFDGFHQGRRERVAVLGSGASARLGLSRLDGNPAIFVNGVSFTVIGVIEDLQRQPELLSSVIIPTATALVTYGPPTEQRAKMLIETKIGAAQVIGEQAAIALRPDAPNLFKVVTPPDPQSLRRTVTSDLNSLFLLLAGISLVVGAVGIANTTLVAVLERTNEIGLRRALGARPRHIVVQFLMESAMLGTLGGLIGTSLAVAIVVVVALVQEWTAVLQPWTVVPAPLVGSLVGLLAGAYPAIRAGWIEPVEALRR